MASRQDLEQAATALSTASDGLSVKVDSMIEKQTAFIAEVDRATLTPAGEAALSALLASATTVAASGDKVDAAVLSLDNHLPTPAPAAPPA
jgi:hypothetical protein